jgi:hypothetical protein
VINGAIDVFNQCSGTGPCDGLNNFWRSLSNLTLNVTLPKTPPAYVPATGEGAACNNTFDTTLPTTPTTRSSMTSGRGGPTTEPAPAGPATAPTPA